MARLSSQRETRNDHQMHTIELFENRGYIKSFNDATSLNNILREKLSYSNKGINPVASPDLVDAPTVYALDTWTGDVVRTSLPSQGTKPLSR